MLGHFAQVPATAVAQPTPFTICIFGTKIEEMRQLIKLARLGSPTYESVQDDRKYGITHSWLEDAREEWLKYDWHQTEDEINSLPNFTLPITHGGKNYTMHSLALFSTSPSAIPALFLHGWPGSILEFIPLLSILKSRHAHDPSSLPYHIIVPSLPGYAFSSAPPLDRNFELQDIAVIMGALMGAQGLGFASYFVQGGDIGSKVARVMAATYPHRVKGVHLNFCIMPDPSTTDASLYTPLETEGLARFKRFNDHGSGYALLHATKPATLSLVLSTNPLSLLAWLGEKFPDWVDPRPPLAPLPLRTILADVSLYWLTDTFPKSLYPYRQLFTPGVVGAHEDPRWYIGADTAVGFSWFPREIAPVPRAWVETTVDKLVFWREHERGGHFAALEQPEVLLEDWEEFVRLALREGSE